MEITYIGHSCFKIKGKNASIVVDPYDPKIGFKMPKQEADILLTTHDHEDHANIGAVSGYTLYINGPGEYEKNGVFVHGIETSHDEKEGSERGKNTIYEIDIDEINILHLGDLGHELPESVLGKLATVDILLVPVGGKYTIDAEQAVEVISEIEPGIVIPMHYKTEDLVDMDGLVGVDKFLEEMGVKQPRQEEKLKLNKSDIPDETEVILLKPAH